MGRRCHPLCKGRCLSRYTERPSRASRGQLLHEWIRIHQAAMNLSHPQKVTASVVALAAIAAAGWVATGDSGPKFTASSKVEATLVLEAPSGEALGGYVIAKYSASSGSSRCERVPRAFGIFPQSAAVPITKFVHIEAAEASGAVSTYRAVKADDSKCQWRFHGFIASPTIAGKEAWLNLKGFGLSSRQNLTAELACHAPFSPAYPALPCVDYNPRRPVLHRININLKWENAPPFSP